MDVTEYCSGMREKLVELWIGRFFTAYPIDSTGFVRTRRDRFANPVGETTRLSAATLFDAVIGKDADADAVKTALRDLILIRAVQDMAPSQATGAIIALKDILRSEVLPACLLPENAGAGTLKNYLEAESRIDTLFLMALDMYAEAREKVYRARIEDIKQSQAQLTRLATLRRTRHEPLPETDNEG